MISDDQGYGLMPDVPAAPALPGDVIVRADEDGLIDALAADLVVHAENCVRQFGDFQIALTGGARFERLFMRLMFDPNYRRLPWRRTHLWIVEEECVAHESLRHAYRSVRDTIGDHADIPCEQFHSIPFGDVEAEATYEQQLRDVLGWREKGQDRLDYVLLPLLGDGSTAGVLAEGTDRLVARARAEGDSAAERIALTIPFVNSSRFVAVMGMGAGTYGAVRGLAAGEAETFDVPLRQVNPTGGELKWYLDGPACGQEPPGEA